MQREPGAVRAEICTPLTHSTDPARTGTRWALYDEKYALQSMKEYLAGRSAEMDPLLEWLERPQDEVLHNALGDAPVIATLDD